MSGPSEGGAFEAPTDREALEQANRSVSATVEEISDRTAIFRTEDGRLRLLQGQFLTEAEKLVSSDEPEAF